MDFEKGKSALPTGNAKVFKNTRETLPLLEVENEVLWVNPNLDYPFKLEAGKQANLGLFLDGNSARRASQKHLEAASGHNRSILLGRVIFGDKNDSSENKQLFRDVDIKGIGHVLNRADSVYTRVGYVSPMSDGGSYGILDYRDATKDALIAEELNDCGVRVSRTIAIIKLKEIIDLDKRISIEDAKARGWIGGKVVPVLEVRAFGTQTRLMDIVGAESIFERKDLLEDAKNLVAQELGKNPSAFTLNDYAGWLAETVGKNVGLMNRHGFVHRYLGMGHNITLDGCLVDFDSVSRHDPRHSWQFDVDRDGAYEALHAFIDSPGLSELGYLERSEILRKFSVTYNQYSGFARR